MYKDNAETPRSKRACWNRIEAVINIATSDCPEAKTSTKSNEGITACLLTWPTASSQSFPK